MSIAYERLGITQQIWNPHAGFKVNRPVLDRLYYYYQQLYLQRPEVFYWCGLARLTGGQVLYGLDHLIKIVKDPCMLTVQIVATAKSIFENLAWQHELFLENPASLLTACKEMDMHQSHTHAYADCWQNAMSKDAVLIAEGNRMLLQNEQLDTIQPHYDLIKTDTYSKRYFWFTRFVMRKIHPAHRRFIFDLPWGDVTLFKDRWQWINHDKGMWKTWINTSLEERIRLVSLSNEKVSSHQWKKD